MKTDFSTRLTSIDTLAQEWADVARTVGYLPLALAQAGSYMSATQSGPASYLKLYDKQRKHLLKKKPPRALWQYGESVISTWEISFASIESVSPSAARLLLICDYFQPERSHICFSNLDPRSMGVVHALRSILPRSLAVNGRGQLTNL